MAYTHIPEVTNVTGTKTWNDNNNQDGIRPESIIIKLLADGKVIQTVKVSADDAWTWTFDNLPKYDDGEEIEYTIEEKEVKGYETQIDGYDVVNTHEVTPEEAPVPDIGDHSNIGFNLLMMCVATVAIKGVLEYKRSLKRHRIS